ncbi:hypothetical protein NQ318_022885 [Aromia moschata]|uniref:DUF4817 domain-containing protein n=1 Tax=Aromia moschata TaxID=1265417 RepID=A0AAV8XXC3_9CUCU|nr:hypothetical protein NQ318_022885 [Aromia moschata]
MAAQFNIEEYTDMILVYGFCEGNVHLSVRVYGERFPNRRLPNHTTFTAVVRRLREIGRFAARTADYGRDRFVRTADVEEEILARVEADPELSTRRIGAEMEISKDVVHRTLKEQLLHPYDKTPEYAITPCQAPEMDEASSQKSVMVWFRTSELG